MKKYIKEIIIFCLQLALFYAYPLVAESPIGMVLSILLVTFLLSVILAALSSNLIKLFYPFATAVSFIPSVFIYYNSSAMIHALWYFVISSVGIALGFGIYGLLHIGRRSKK